MESCGALSPIANLRDLDGCYFAAGPNWLFKISDGKLADPEGHELSAVALSQPSAGQSSVMLTPGVRLTETPAKSTVMVQGNTRKLIGVKQFGTVRLTFVDAVGTTTFKRERCS